MEIYFEEIFKYIQPGLLGKIDLKAYSDNKISILNAVNDFSEQKELECYQFSIHFKGLERARTDQEKREEWLIIWGTDSAVPCKKSIRSNPYLVSLFNQFIQEIISKETGYQYIIQSLNIQLLISLLRVIGQNLKGGERN